MEKINSLIDQLVEKKIDRRQFLVRAAAIGLSASAISTILAACGTESATPTSAPAAAATTAPAAATSAPAAVVTATPGGGAGGMDLVRWVSPRGNLEVPDDYMFYVAQKMGYWDKNLDVKLEPGPMEATATTKLVDQGQSDIGYPSPGVFTLALEAGLPLISAFHMGAYNVFDYAVKEDSPITDMKGLAGKTISLGDAGWQAISDPILVEVGVDPKTVKYVAAGPQWAQSVEAGQADAALSWEGYRGMWIAQGLKLKYFLGYKFSKGFANSWVIRKKDLDDPKKVDIYTRFFKGAAMGLEFGYWNMTAATMITWEKFPALQKNMNPEIGTESCRELANIFRGDWAKRQGWGWHDLAAWADYFKIVKGLGQLTKDVKPEDVITNDFVKPSNDFDHDKVKADAQGYKLTGDWAKVPATIKDFDGIAPEQPKS
ncbi:MAG: ABC transporter substrate-binding protein [Chloroflexi bacterium]|nr:ABC transporter substrate-binding protein [Chloroflexota bacterium]